VDGRVRHELRARVVVSGRTIGRAVGGMADTIRRRLTKPDETLDERLEPASNAAQRAYMRRLMRTVWRGGKESIDALKSISSKAKLSEREVKTFCLSKYFGEAWTALEASTPILRRELVLTSNLVAETQRAQTILDFLTKGASRKVPRTAGQADISDSGTDAVA
jgi:hypothetical protein